MAESELLSAAERSIKLCVSEYTRLSGKALFSEVDTVLVHVSANQFGVLFTHGEVGTFGERSQDYRSYMSCGFLASDDLKIYYIDVHISDLLIKDPEFDAIYSDFYEGKVKELLYQRSGDEFTFVAIQDFVEPDLNLPSRLVRGDLANAHVLATDGDMRGVVGLLSRSQVAQYHYTVFATHDLYR